MQVLGTSRARQVAAIAALVLLAGAMTAGANHTSGRVLDRYVAPSSQQEVTFIPIAAGYEPVPTPQHCAPAAAVPGTLYTESFESGLNGWTLNIATKLASTHTSLWNVVNLNGYATKPAGSDAGHDGPNRLYFGYLPGNAQGRPAWSTGGAAWQHIAGTAQSPEIELPAAGDFTLVFATKWGSEWLKGYDHLWVELKDTTTGRIHLLCTANALDRADPNGLNGGSTVGSCSPFLLHPCPGAVFSMWEQRATPIPPQLLGKTVQIRFTYDSADPLANMYLGWMVDDVRIVG